MPSASRKVYHFPRPRHLSPTSGRSQSATRLTVAIVSVLLLGSMMALQGGSPTNTKGVDIALTKQPISTPEGKERRGQLPSVVTHNRRVGDVLKSGLPEGRLSHERAFSAVPFEPLFASTAGSCRFTFTPKDPSPADCSTDLFAWDFDNSNLGARTPLILIHGIHGNRQSFSALVNYFTQNHDGLDFNGKFKIYTFEYSSDRFPIWEIARSLRNRVDDSR
jgi:hypothetical protein